MALPALANAYNDAVDAAVVALKAYIDDAGTTAGTELIFVPLDRGDSSTNPDHRTNTAAGAVPTYSHKMVHYHVDDGDTPIRVVGPDGQLHSLFWKITNQAEELL